MNKNSNDIINEIIKNNSHLKGKVNSLSQEDLKRTVKNVNRAEATAKLRSMGLGSIADKLANISDDELVQLVSQNPGLLKKINSFLK